MIAKYPLYVVGLKNTDATKLAQALQTMLDNRLTAAGIKAGGKVLVVAEPRTNALIISAPQERFDEVSTLVTKLDAMPAASAGNARVVVLDNNDATAVATELNNFFQQRTAGGTGGGASAAEKVTVLPDVATNSLLISASDDNFKTLMDMVTRLDAAPPVEALVRTFTLQNADATQVADTLSKLFQGGVFKKGGLAGAPGDKTAKITVTTDPRSNSIIVSAKEEFWPLIENLVHRMDSPEAPFTMAGAFTIIPLKHSDAVKMASLLQDLLDRMDKAETTTGRKPTTPQPIIIPDPRTNSLLVSATPAGVERIQTLVTRLDLPSGLPTAEIRVYTLKEASADHIEQIITNLLTQRGQGAGGGGGAGAPGADRGHPHAGLRGPGQQQRDRLGQP